MTLFIDADVEQIKQLRLVLLSFELLIGLKINFSKSQIFGVGYEGDRKQFSDLLGCYFGILPSSYLGFPPGDKYKGISKWDKVIDRFISSLAG